MFQIYALKELEIVIHALCPHISLMQHHSCLLTVSLCFLKSLHKALCYPGSERCNINTNPLCGFTFFVSRFSWQQKGGILIGCGTGHSISSDCKGRLRNQPWHQRNESPSFNGPFRWAVGTRHAEKMWHRKTLVSVSKTLHCPHVGNNLTSVRTEKQFQNQTNPHMIKTFNNAKILMFSRYTLWCTLATPISSHTI